MKSRRRITVTGAPRAHIDARALAELLITIDELRTQAQLDNTDPETEDDTYDQQEEGSEHR